ncbi:hypothetical protein HanOQP8_Chr05g0178911 [Helianthus annuus]|nr:hypothetical protein HanOQP8_Chr05g0178911 [Helianthus annuus]KAJ0749904.1 hypothetical protein HanLR1_Chr05g0175581 [Helianthus annuus]
MTRSGSCFRCCLVVLAVISALCVSGPALYWKLKREPTSSISCTPCICDCPPPLSLIKLAPGIKPFFVLVVLGLFLTI